MKPHLRDFSSKCPLCRRHITQQNDTDDDGNNSSVPPVVARPLSVWARRFKSSSAAVAQNSDITGTTHAATAGFTGTRNAASADTTADSTNARSGASAVTTADHSAALPGPRIRDSMQLQSQV